jgi:hypothetical protein
MAIVAAAAFAPASAHAASLAVVIAIDVSGSVAPDSYILQRDGTARAFEDPELRQAVAAAPGGIEALVIEWSDPDKVAVTIDWTAIVGPASAGRFAAAIRAMPRTSHGLTAIGPALATAAWQFARLPQRAARRVIDLSGNGMANLGEPPQVVRDRLVKAGITINGLPILTPEPWLADYYRHNIIGGPGAFVVAARDFRAFAEAMRRKLAAEVAGAAAPVPVRQAGFSRGARPSGPGKIGRDGG